MRGRPIFSFVSRPRGPTIGLLLLLAAFGVAACEQEQTADGAPAEAPAPTVTVVTVERRDVTAEFSFVGHIEATDHVDVRARVEGFVEDRLFEEGEDVSAGELLFIIEPEPFEASVMEADANLQRAMAAIPLTQRALGRAEQLFSRGNISEAALDDARAATEQAIADVAAREAELDRALINLSYTRIISPIDGRVSREAFSVGNLVGPDSGVLTTVTRLDPIYALFSVSERDVIAFRRQQAAGDASLEDIVLGLRLPDDTDYGTEGRIDFVDSQVNPTTGTVTVRGVFANADRFLLPGQFVTVVVTDRQSESALTVPQAAIQQDQAGRFVLVVNENSRVEVRRIEVGQQIETDWVVEGGLTEGDRVVTDGIQRIRPGVDVTPVFAAPASEG